MSRKIINCKEAPEIEIQMNDGGDIALLRFDIHCISNIQELEEGLDGFLKLNTAEMAAALVYCAGKNQTEDLTIEKARQMVSCMSPDSVLSIIEEFTDSMGVKAGDGDVKKMMAQFLQKK